MGTGPADLLLQEMARRLRAGVRGTDTVARARRRRVRDRCRWVSTSRDAHAFVPPPRRAHLRAPFRVDGYELYVGASLGVALAPANGAGPRAAAQERRHRLYRAKQTGRGTFRFFEAQMDAELQTRRALEQDLRQALAKGQFELHYQPLVAVQGHGSPGWRRCCDGATPAGGVVPAWGVHPGGGGDRPHRPDRGVGAADRLPPGQGLAGPACVREPVARAVQAPRARGARSSRALRETPTSRPHRLELEVTENVLLYDTAGALHILASPEGNRAFEV